MPSERVKEAHLMQLCEQYGVPDASGVIARYREVAHKLSGHYTTPFFTIFKLGGVQMSQTFYALQQPGRYDRMEREWQDAMQNGARPTRQRSGPSQPVTIPAMPAVEWLQQQNRSL
jgi:hypothetical protein